MNFTWDLDRNRKLPLVRNVKNLELLSKDESSQNVASLNPKKLALAQHIKVLQV